MLAIPAACSFAAHPLAAQPPARRSIRGRVVVGAARRPLAGAVVELRGGDTVL